MALDLINQCGGVRFYCTTSERAFGPVMPSFEVSQEFSKHLGADARKFNLQELEEKWEAFKLVRAVDAVRAA